MVVKLKKNVWVCPRRVVSGSPGGARYGNHPIGAVIELDDPLAARLIIQFAAEEVKDQALFPASHGKHVEGRKKRGRPVSASNHNRN